MPFCVSCCPIPPCNVIQRRWLIKSLYSHFDWPYINNVCENNERTKQKNRVRFPLDDIHPSVVFFSSTQHLVHISFLAVRFGIHIYRFIHLASLQFSLSHFNNIPARVVVGGDVVIAISSHLSAEGKQWVERAVDSITLLAYIHPQ